MALDKVVDSAVLDAGMKSVADAIRAKAGITDLLAWPDGFKAAVEGIQTGGGGGSTSDVEMKDVNFYDYDGTLVASYTLAEAQALTALPDGPTHDGLTFQGWNWSLADLKITNRKMNVGAMYITDDGKTRIYIRLEEGRTSPMLGVCPNGTVTVDWGDGTTPDTLTGTSTNTVKWTPNHNYATPGDYVIKLTVNGTMSVYGESSSNQYGAILRYSSSADQRNHVYQNSVKRVEIGDGVTSIGRYAFQNCYSLTSITIPDSVTRIDSSAFYTCYSLASITIPNGVTSIGGYTFSACYSLTSITIPNGVTSIGTYAFQNCYSLASITIPNSVTSIGGYAFKSCFGIAFYDFSNHIAVPTLANTNAFQGIAADCQIRVPASLVDAWKTATNWSTYADHIVGV